MLAKAGITNQHQLSDLGPVLAFLAVRQTGQNPSMNLLWAMAAGLQDRHWTDLPTAEEDQLRDELSRLTR
jgi:DNA transformation protein